MTRYRIQDMSMAKSLLDTYSMLRDHQARVAKWVKLWHHSFDILSKPRPCWTAEETAYISRMDNFSAVCHKSVLRSGTHLGATFDRAHEHTIEAAKKLAVPARDVDVQAKGLRRAAACIFDDCDSDEAQHNAAQACQVTLATISAQAGDSWGRSENPTYRSLARTPICRGRMASASSSPSWASPTRSSCCSGRSQSPQAPCACGCPWARRRASPRRQRSGASTSWRRWTGCGSSLRAQRNRACRERWVVE